MRTNGMFFMALAVVGSVLQAQNGAQSFSLTVFGAPASGIVWQRAPRPIAPGAQLECSVQGERIEAQYIPSTHHHGCFAIRLPAALIARSQDAPLQLDILVRPAASQPPRPQNEIVLRMPAYTLTMRSDRQGGMPSQIVFPSGRVLDSISWEDRVFDNIKSAENAAYSDIWRLNWDPAPTLTVVADGPVCTVVSHQAHFCRKNGSRPPNEPSAQYQWVFFKDETGLILVEAHYRQEQPHSWKELHFLDWHVDDGALPDWYGCNLGALDKVAKGQVADKKFLSVFSAWAVLADQKDFIAIHDSDVRIYADHPGERIYLHAATRFAWSRWDQPEAGNAAWLQIGTATESVPETISSMAQALRPKLTRWQNAAADWRQSLANAARCYGRDDANRRSCERESADLAMVFGHYEHNGGQSLALDALVDKADGALLMEQSQALFCLNIQNRQDQSMHTLDSTMPWRNISISPEAMLFHGPLGVADAEELQVRVLLTASPAQPGVSWRLEFIPGSERWRAQSASVGVLCLEALGTSSHALTPGPEGSVVHDPFSSQMNITSTYPSLTATMGFMAVWDDGRGGGMYVGAHDPDGAYKRMSMRNPGGSSQIVIEYEHRLPFWPNEPARSISTPGTIHWRSFRGDWYEATKLYRDWVRENAGWYPPMGPEGRRTTPLWLKQLCVWGRVFGEAKAVVPQVRKFRETMGLPCGIHWYQWHQIPFDNDYPHYLPAKEGFAQGVRDIQALDCYVMPYTNGRLWDTRDRGMEDWQFSAVGKAGATKRADGSVVSETYRSTESDGSKVVLAVMCPASQTWKDKITENDRALAIDYGLNGVYMDQIGAGSPVLCEDPTHGHPLGGGSWWVAGYKNILQGVRAILPPDRILATECNSEAVVDLLDAMICWHIEAENTVPAYSVIYSDVVFRYGSAYDNNIRAMRMKWAHNLINGNTPGWFPPSFMDNPAMRDYLVPLVHFRHHNIEYFYRGELSRPPRLRDKVHSWAENWNLFGRYSVNTLPCVQTAVRRILDYDYDSQGKRLWASGRVQSALLICTNFSTEDATSAVILDWQEIGIDPAKAQAQRVEHDGTRTPFAPALLDQPMLFPAGKTWGIEITPGKK
ncbi:MAG: hypothetical protein GX945_05585 [Lentisphaerae bacterium]|nr:hypothetical protein [Lentisphaerota bacterium]